MNQEDRNNKIKELVAGKDYLEQGLAVLRVAGYNQYSDVQKDLVSVINSLRADIFGLQTGALPFVKVVKTIGENK